MGGRSAGPGPVADRAGAAVGERVKHVLAVGFVLVFVVGMPVGLWYELRGTPFGSQFFLFGGRALDGPVSGSVVFTVTGDDGRSSLRIVDASGGEVRVVVDDLVASSPVAVSRDGTRAAYAVRAGDGDGYVLRVLGVPPVSPTGVRPVDLVRTRASADQLTSLAWSPDGTRLAFNAALGGDSIVSVHVVPAAGGEVRRLGPEPEQHSVCLERIGRPDCVAQPTGDARRVAWLGDGRVAYLSEVMGSEGVPEAETPASDTNRTRLHTVDVEGRRPQLLLEVEGPLDQLVASPDGRYLLHGLSTGEAHVRDLHEDGGEPRRLADQIATPAWSADGRRLVFVNNRNVMAAHADGQGVEDLTHIPWGPSEGSAPEVTPSAAAWSAGRRHIAFVGNGDSVYVMNADGTGWTKIADADGQIESVAWLPAD